MSHIAWLVAVSDAVQHTCSPAQTHKYTSTHPRLLIDAFMLHASTWLQLSLAETK